MSVPDYIHCKMALPADTPECIKKSPFFQTSDLGNAGSDFVITEDGELQIEHSIMANILCEALEIDPEAIPPTPIFWKRKKITMYASNCRGGGPRDGKYVWFTDDGSDYVRATMVVQIRSGKVSSIKMTHCSSEPALPFSEFHK